MKNRFKAKNPLSWKFRFHTQTSGVTLVAQEPENNVVRVTLQALASVLGGTQSLHTNSRDEALSLPSEKSVQIALRTQQIIAHESGVTDTVDPLGGSYFMENLTNQIELKVNEYLKKIEDMGGMLKAIEKGYIQKEIQESAFRYQKQIEKKEQIVVGLNEFVIDKRKLHFKLYYPPEKLERIQVDKLREIKEKRSKQAVTLSLQKLKEAAQGEKNILPPLIEAVKTLATLGEISSVLEEEYGTYKENINI